MLYDAIIHAGIMLLLVYLPLAFGGVTEHAVALLEVMSGSLMLVWLLKLLTQRQPQGVRTGSGRDRCYAVLTPVPGLAAIAGFLLLIGLQQVPLPAGWVGQLSPQAQALYAEAAAAVGQALPASLPLSVQAQATTREWGKYLAYGMVFFLLIQTITTRRQLRRFYLILMGMGVLQAGYAILDLLTPTRLLPFYQGTGSYVNKNHFAGYLSMALLVGLGVLFTRFEGRTRTAQSPLKARVEQLAKIAIWLAGLAVMLCALLLSQSRGGQISGLFGVLVFLGLARSRRRLRHWNRIVSMLLVAVLALTLFLTPVLVAQGMQRFEGEALADSLALRFEIWAISWHIFRDFPWCGAGLGTFGSLTRRYQHFRSPLVFVYTESDLLRILAETGVAGMLLALAAGGSYAAGVWRLWRRRRARRNVAVAAGGLAALAAMTLHAAVDFNWHVPANAFTLTVVAALTYAAAFVREPVSDA